MKTPKCPKCAQPMDDGLLLDHIQGGQMQMQWIGGPPESSFWTGLKTRDRPRFPVSTYRCPKCGYLESYARPPEGE